MARLIDEDKAKEVFTDYYHIHTTIQRISLEEAFSRVPTVDAISIKWMKSWAMKNWAKTKKSAYDIIVSKLIDDWWERENAK